MAIRRHAQRKHFHFYSRWSSWTFVQNVAAKPISWRAEHWVLGGVALILTALVGIVIPGWANATRHDPAPAAYTTLAIDVPQLRHKLALNHDASVTLKLVDGKHWSNAVWPARAMRRLFWRLA